MNRLEQELFEFIGNELHELSWHCNLPLNEGIALWGFREALRKHPGMNVESYDGRTQIRYKVPLVGRLQVFQTSLTDEEVLKGWGSSPQASPSSLYHSLFKVFDNLALSDKSINKKSINN